MFLVVLQATNHWVKLKFNLLLTIRELFNIIYITIYFLDPIEQLSQKFSQHSVDPDSEAEKLVTRNKRLLYNSTGILIYENINLL